MISDDDEDERPKGPVYNLEKTLDAPRKKHGTRVLLNVVCSGCGKESTLDYKPKGVSLKAILCEACMKETAIAPRWEIVREKKSMEAGGRQWTLTCADCGRKELVSKPLRKGKVHVCRRCKEDEATPDHSRLEGAEPLAEGEEGSPLIRRKKTKES